MPLLQVDIDQDDLDVIRKHLKSKKIPTGTKAEQVNWAVNKLSQLINNGL